MVRVGAYKKVLAVHQLTGPYPSKDILIAGRYRRRKAVGQMFAIDRLLGDDQYIFLSIEAMPSLYFGAAYVFDAEDLIRRGAKVRTMDIAYMDEFEALDALLRDMYEEGYGYGHQTTLWDFDASQTQQLRRAIDRYPVLQDSFAQLRDTSRRITLSGDDAISFIRNPARWPRGSDPPDGPELLVPKKLPLAESVGFIPYGGR